MAREAAPGVPSSGPVTERIETAFVLGGGGVLGCAEVGMLHALLERGIIPDLVVGSSVGALNGALVAADPSMEMIQRMSQVWGGLNRSDVFSGSLLSLISNLARHGTHLHGNDGLRRLLEGELHDLRIEDMAVRYECVATCIERASTHYFSSGPVIDAVLASCAVPGLLPPVRIGGDHYFDGGLVDSVPVGRAVALGARRIFVLEVGRLEQQIRPPRNPWEVALVTFVVTRRHRFEEAMASLPKGAEVIVLPTGSFAPPLSMSFRNADVATRIRSAYEASKRHLDDLQRTGS